MLYLIPSIFNEIEVIWRKATNLLLLFCFYFLLFWMATIFSCISFLLFYFFDIVIQDLKICLSLNLIHSVLNEMEVIWRKNCVFVLLFWFSFCFFERPNVYYFFSENLILDLKSCLFYLIHSVLNKMEVIWRKNGVFVLLFCFSFCFFERPNVYYFFLKI